MSENDNLQDLDVTGDDGEAVTGGTMRTGPVTAVVPGAEATLAGKEKGVKHTVSQTITPMHPNF